MPRDGAPARSRMREAALELYAGHGYEATTAAQIAKRAGVSERTYFRHFADKREVLFDGEAELTRRMVDAVVAAPPGVAPLPTVVRAFEAAVPMVVANRGIAERRAEIIAVTPALQERAQAKAVALVEALAAALAGRGVPPATARLAAQVGMAAFDHASRAWAGDPTLDLGTLLTAAVDLLGELGAAPTSATRRSSGGAAEDPRR